jgi:hypothetical protein
MAAKYERTKNRAETNPFVDPQGYRAFVELKEKAFQRVLASQRAGSTGKQRQDKKKT